MSLLNDECDLCGSQCLHSPTAKANELRLWCGRCGVDRVQEVNRWLSGEGDPPMGHESRETVIRVHPKVVQLVGLALTLLLSAWWLMLILGAVHSAYPAIVALPFWVVLLGLLGLRCVTAVLPNAAHYHEIEDE